MWLEIKGTITVIGCFIIAVIVGLLGNLVFAILAIMAMSTFIVGDLILGFKLISTDAINVLDPVGPNEKIIDFHMISGRKRFLKAKKGPEGTWQFVFSHHKGSIIDNGRGTYRLANGNPTLLGHEGYDKNIDPIEAKYLEYMFDKYKVDDVMKLYDVLVKREDKLKKQGELIT